VKDKHSLSIFWQHPAIYDEEIYVKFKPFSFVSHLLGYEGQGSILSLLKEKGWAASLSASTDYASSSFCMPSVSLDLTDEGFIHRFEIVEIVFTYIELIKNAQSDWRRIFDEIQNLKRVSYNFRSKTNAYSDVVSFVARLRRFPPSKILEGPFLLYEYDADKILTFLNHLSLENSIVFFASKKLASGNEESFSKEEWYQTKYRSKSFDSEFIAKTKALRSIEGLHIPLPNPYISRDFSLKGNRVSPEIKPPELVFAEGPVQVWHKMDFQFSKPRLQWMVQLMAQISCTPRQAALFQCFQKLLSDFLTEKLYDAILAGLSVSLSESSLGFEISGSGYNEKLPILMLEFISIIKEFKVRPDRFLIVKEKLIRAFKNARLNQPYDQALSKLRATLETNGWDTDQVLVQLEKCSSSDVQIFAASLFSDLAAVHMFFMGNIESADAIEHAKSFLSAIDYDRQVLEANVAPTPRYVCLDSSEEFFRNLLLFNEEEKNSAVVVHHEIGEAQLSKAYLAASLFAMLTSQRCFDQLRTKEQLGYIVSSYCQANRGVQFYRITVQSSIKRPEFLESRVDVFLSSLKVLYLF
jgi:insulysin